MQWLAASVLAANARRQLRALSLSCRSKRTDTKGTWFAPTRRSPTCKGEVMKSAEVSQSPRQQSPALLTIVMIREQYVPIGTRTLFRMISEGRFPKADFA